MKLTNYKIKGKCMWAVVQEPRPAYKKPDVLEYSINIQVTDEIIKDLNNLGVEFGEGKLDRKIYTEGGERYIKVKTPKVTSTGRENSIKVVGPDKKLFKGLVGNGSEVIVRLVLIDQEKGDAPLVRFDAVKIVNLVEYSVKEFDEDFDTIEEEEPLDEDFDDIDDINF